MWPAAEASAKLPPPATCQRSKFSATKVLPTHRILPPPSKAPAIRRTTQPSPWLQYGAAGLPAPPRLTPPSAAARLHPRLQGSNHLLQPPPTRQSSHTLHQQKIGPWQNSVKFSPAPASLSHDVQASQISSPSTILSSPGNFKIPPLHSNQRPQRARAANHPTRGPAQSSLPQGPARSGRPPASLGRAPDTAALSPHLPRASTERQLATQPSEEPAFASTSRRTRTSSPPSAAYSYTQPRTNEPLPYPWPAAPPLTASPTPSAQAPAPPPFPPPLSPSTKLFQAQTYPNHRPKHQPFPLSSTQSAPSPEPPFSLSTASPLPIPPNALALEPPPVANSIRSQILSEIQNIGTGGRSTPHPSTSLFRTDIPLNHPLKPLLEASLNSILQAVSPRTLQSYLTAWKSFKTFHSTYNLPFPTFSLLAITSFISHLNINKKLQTTSI